MRAQVACLCVGLVALACLFGCQRQFCRERFEQITVGVDDCEDVRQLLGKPSCELADQWLYDDLDHHLSAVIYFDEHGRVTGKQWIDAKNGRWEGNNPAAGEVQTGEVREVHVKTRRIDED